ncbi:hypothetical protein ACU4GD_11145 [Cupriavidus basilensis]
MTISQSDRASRSIVDHLRIIEALEKRDTELQREAGAPAFAGTLAGSCAEEALRFPSIRARKRPGR